MIKNMEQYLEKLYEGIECPNCFDGRQVVPEQEYLRIDDSWVCPKCKAKYISFLDRHAVCFECKKEKELKRFMIRRVQKLVRLCMACYRIYSGEFYRIMEVEG